jgi:hypothetical protein
MGAAMIACLAAGCGPSVDDEPEPLGVLEYGSYTGGWYRLERRIEFVPDPEYGFNPPQCAYLTEHAYEKIEDTIAALDPTVDYDFGAEGAECLYFDDFGAVYLEGFEHSPFSCGIFCCRDELARVSSTYLHVWNNLDGEFIEVDGEPYVAVDFDRSCE